MASTLLPLLAKANECSIVLASGSPRRRELLSLMGIHNYAVKVSTFKEDLDKSKFITSSSYCLATAVKKVEEVARSIENKQQLQSRMIIIGADTIVEVNDRILEKPADDDHARNMIKQLSGCDHRVHTAVVGFSNFKGSANNDFSPHFPLELTSSNIDSDVMWSETGAAFAFVETSTVTFADLTEADITAYVATGEGRDKAGSYGIQGIGSQLVRGIQGCYFNVMGLPIHRLSATLNKIFAGSKT